MYKCRIHIIGIGIGVFRYKCNVYIYIYIYIGFRKKITITFTTISFTIFRSSGKLLLHSFPYSLQDVISDKFNRLIYNYLLLIITYNYLVINSDLLFNSSSGFS